MHLEKKIVDNNLVLRLRNDFDLVISEQFKAEVENIFNQAPINNIVINLQDVNFIDSSGLGVILGRYKQLGLKNGKLALVNPKPQVRKILEFSGVTKIINIYMNENDALREF